MGRCVNVNDVFTKIASTRDNVTFLMITIIILIAGRSISRHTAALATQLIAVNGVMSNIMSGS